MADQILTNSALVHVRHSIYDSLTKWRVWLAHAQCLIPPPHIESLGMRHLNSASNQIAHMLLKSDGMHPSRQHATHKQLMLRSRERERPLFSPPPPQQQKNDSHFHNLTGPKRVVRLEGVIQ